MFFSSFRYSRFRYSIFRISVFFPLQLIPINGKLGDPDVFLILQKKQLGFETHEHLLGFGELAGGVAAQAVAVILSVH
jgi:hypothetical protein